MSQDCRRLSGAIVLVCSGGMAAVPAAQERTTVSPPLTHTAHLARDWTLDGSGTWALRDGVLALLAPGMPGGVIRRPLALAILAGADFADVALAAEIRSTAAMPDVAPRRDVLLIVGYQSPARFYYVHLSAARDAVHNGIFLVHDADRRRIDDTSAVAPLVDQQWHRARVVRTVKSGRIEVFLRRPHRADHDGNRPDPRARPRRRGLVRRYG